MSLGLFNSKFSFASKLQFLCLQKIDHFLRHIAINLNTCLHFQPCAEFCCSPPFNVCQKFKRAEAAGQDEETSKCVVT